MVLRLQGRDEEIASWHEIAGLAGLGCDGNSGLFTRKVTWNPKRAPQEEFPVELV